MQIAKQETCLRCQASFECKVDAIEQCQCRSVALSSETIRFLERTEYGCLCATCLAHYQALTDEAQSTAFPTDRESLIENKHYYMENGYVVFTELYHFLRGFCCKNGCRHCVYGFNKIPQL
ncbi:MAG: cysteine-rich CWC family protein [Flavobacteriia bacterium]|nr:cysteine-rich CWC family protein [Flavobacteriia bacterium]